MTATARRVSAATDSPDTKGVSRPGQAPHIAVSANGSETHAEPLAQVIQFPAGPKAPRRTRWVDIPEYEGFKMEIWVNYPQRLYEQMFGDDPKAADEASSRIFIQHNNWCDDEGNPYPALSDPLFWPAIPNELAGVMIAVLRREASELPNLLVRQRGR